MTRRRTRTTSGPTPSQTRSTSARSRMPLVALLVLLAVFCAGIGVGQLSDLRGLTAVLRGGNDSGLGDALRASVPTGLSIPSVGVDATVVRVGRAADGSIATPRDDPARTAGWFALGPTPGERGSAVIVGHVDTDNRPAVFERLPDLRRGKLIEVRRSDRRVATFTVDSVETFAKTSFPADRVFATQARPRLVLVTCGGPWVGGDTGYADNVIVFATLV
jgi:hypothetical protein